MNELREKIAEIVCNEDMDCLMMADQILALFREEVEKVELLDYPPFLPICDRHLYAKGFIVCRQAILSLLQEEKEGK